MITKQKVENDIEQIKVQIRKSYQKNNFQKTIDLLYKASVILYNFNYCFQDKELENFLFFLSEKISSDFTISKLDQLRVIQYSIILYDNYPCDNCGLTQQYIRALTHLNINFVYVTYSDFPNIKSSDIFTELNENKNCLIRLISDQRETFNAAIELYTIFSEYNPDKIITITMPWDVSGLMAINRFSKAQRYLVNATDHAYWLGINCFDYFLEFRDFGFNLSIDFRKISETKLIKLPYYPIINKNEQFMGWPADFTGKKIVFSGGSLYKIYDKQNTFLNILKRVLIENPDTVAVFAGTGSKKPFIDFIEANSLQGRLFLLGYRRDISFLFSACDLFLGTYPFCGGLMTQYAISMHKNMVSYFDDRYIALKPETLLLHSDKVRLSYTNLEELHGEINKLICDNVYNKNKEKLLIDEIISPELFSESLGRILNNQHSGYYFERKAVVDKNVDDFSELYFDQENTFFHNYNIYKYGKNKLKLIFLNPKLILTYFIKSITIIITLLKKIRNKIVPTLTNIYVFLFILKKRMPMNSFYSIGIPDICVSKTGVIQNSGHITMVNTFKHSTLGKTNKCKITVYDNAFLQFNGKVAMSNATIIASKKIVIGNNVMIGGGVTIVDTDFHSLDYINWFTIYDELLMIRKPIEIGNNVFLGMNSIILKGVVIGDGAVVAAGSVVSKNIPSNEIWGGNPARFISVRK